MLDFVLRAILHWKNDEIILFTGSDIYLKFNQLLQYSHPYVPEYGRTQPKCIYYRILSVNISQEPQCLQKFILWVKKESTKNQTPR